MNIFKKKEDSPKPLSMTINNKIYAIEDSTFIKVQPVATDVDLYGWSLETKYNKSTYGSWYSHSNRIYNSRESAMDAALKIDRSFYDYRILPLYRMTEIDFREYKINKLFGEIEKKEKYEIKGWKLKEDIEWYRYNNHIVNHKKGSIYIQLENGDIIKSGTACETMIRCGKDKLFKELIPKGLVEEINIKDEKWLYPHLLKEVKTKLEINKK
jgi:hypothetical protein